jgi:hypothetical protein
MIKPKSKRKTTFYKEDVDAYYDVVIVGGGIMGSSVAYWLAQRVYQGRQAIQQLCCSIKYSFLNEHFCKSSDLNVS